MAVTFDNNQDLSNMVHFDGNATYTARDKTTGDFFNDNDRVGACLYFGWSRGVWHDLVVDVGTPLVAGSITLVWEYYHRISGWIAVPGIVDNTNAFQNAGVNTVSFPVPARWHFQYNIGWYSHNGLMIRARITAVTNLTEGGANKNTAVYGKDYAIKITGDEKMSTVKIANDSGGWGVVNNTAKYYQIISNLRLAGNFIVQRETLDVGTELDRRVILKASGILELGKKDVSGDFYNGATINYWNADTPQMNPYNKWYGTLNMYNSKIWKHTGGYGDYALKCALDVQSSAFEMQVNTLMFDACTGIIKDVTFVIVSQNPWVYWYSGNCEIDNMIFGKVGGVLAGSGGSIIKNTDFGTTKRYVIGNNYRSVYALNCDFDDVTTQAYATGTGNAIYVKYTLKLMVIDRNNNLITGYNVKLTDSQGNILNNGAWTDQDITTHLSETDGAGNRTDTDYNPMTIEISKAGYQTYTSKFTIEKGLDWTITLKQIRINIDNEVIC